VQLVGGLNILAILAPARITGVDDAIPASAESARADDLPVPDIPVTKTLDIGTTYRVSSDDVPVHHGEVSPHSMLPCDPGPRRRPGSACLPDSSDPGPGADSVNR
jgi:hypothetical protein